MKTSLEVAYDRLGQEMRVGSFIVAPYTRARTVVAQVVNITKCLVEFEDINRNRSKSIGGRPVYKKRHDEVVCIDGLGDAVVMAKLKQNL